MYGMALTLPADCKHSQHYRPSLCQWRSTTHRHRSTSNPNWCLSYSRLVGTRTTFKVYLMLQQERLTEAVKGAARSGRTCKKLSPVFKK